MPTSESEVRPPRAVSMSDLLAAGAAANAVSTPPGAARPGSAAAPPRGSAPSGPRRA
ncbi:hypothetical protein ACIQOF_19585 [Streptomyces sp. NPDC091265]|uniref:hypothetical protein n=1 Tax=unclassified Streptomyces TaxID=2593676 RepID=UPI00344B3BD8|nr:hypothetical protein [Streptomyces sp. RKAG290]